jgi:hypothetical protein
MAAKPDVTFSTSRRRVSTSMAATIRAIIRDLAAGSCAVVLATHELDEAERLADRMVSSTMAHWLPMEPWRSCARARRDPVRNDPGLDLRALALRPESSPARSARQYVIDAAATPPDGPTR